MLTPKQVAMYQFIRRFFAKMGKAPTLQEIAHGLGTKSRGVVHRTLQHLASLGYINIESGKKRGIKINEEMIFPSSLLPIAGHIMAGAPSQPIQKEDMLDVSELLLNDKLHVIRVLGLCDYLSDLHINVGDYIICEQSHSLPLDKLAVVMVNDTDFMICYVHPNDDGTLTLKSPSDKQRCLPAEEVVIKGVYSGLIRLNEIT